jgi:hypothetical protein
VVAQVFADATQLVPHFDPGRVQDFRPADARQL